MRFLAALALGLLLAVPAMAKPHFPSLTGRVVDNAHLLSPQTQQSLEQDLANFEQQTGNQFVVATLPTLDGLTIEEYGYKLARAWGVGQKSKNNGILLLVAPKDRSVRIEVGYGLEGTMTDALSSEIIQTIVLPKFKQGDMEGGILGGTTAIEQVLEGTYKSATARVQSGSDSSNYIFLFILFWILLSFFRRRRGLGMLPFFFLGRGGRSSGNSGGFSGGGGGFGGGGSTGRW